MMELISKVQQLVDESRFVEAQKEAEYLLIHGDKSIRPKLLGLYLKSLQNQSRALPIELVIEFVELNRISNIELAQEWIEKTSAERNSKFYKRVLVQSLLINEARGKVEQLYSQISDLQIRAFERRSLKVPLLVEDLIDQYFANDFTMELRRTCLELLMGDISLVEKKIKDLILSCYEQSNRKSITEKISAIENVLRINNNSCQLDIYYNLCRIITKGLNDKKDNKYFSEIVIYVDDFRLQCIILTLISQFFDVSISYQYAEILKKNTQYSFVYIDKYFKDLKKYFVNDNSKTILSEASEKIKNEYFDIKKITKQVETGFVKLYKASEEEEIIARLLRVQEFSIIELIDLATGFLQSELPVAALRACDLIIKRTKNDGCLLKAYYIKLTCLLMMEDYRSALDTALQSLEKVESSEEMLSFLYCQAEAHSKLGEFQKAKQVLLKITQIDSNYRMAREKLEALNEI